MRAVIDIDGVLADMHTKMLDTYNKANGTNMTINDVTEWDLHPEFVEIFMRKGFFADLPLVDNARGFLYGLEQMCEIIIASSPSKMPWIAMDKMIWMNQYLPEYADRLCITEKKNIFDASILLDDYHMHVVNFNGALPLLVNRPWNINEKWIDPNVRVDTLADALYKINRYVKTGQKV